MTTNTIVQTNKYFSKFGVNQIFPFQADKSSYAEDSLNFRSQISDGIEKRQGFHVKTTGQGGYGIWDNTYTNYLGQVVEEVLVADTQLYRLQSGTLNITYSGSNPRATVQIIVNNGQFQLILIDGTTTVLTTNTGQGFDEVSTVTMSALATTISGVTNFAATVTGLNTTPAAFLTPTNETSIYKNQTINIGFKYLSAIQSFQSFDGIASNKQTSNSKLITAVNNRGSLVLTDGNLPKIYDGDCVYLAGLPQPPTPVISTLSNGFLNQLYFYFITYQFIDFQGNLTESAFSKPVSVGFLNQQANLLIGSLTSTSGYNTKFATISGNQTAVTPTNGQVTLTVNSGHTYITGNFAYFFNSYSSVNAYKAYTIVGTTSTSLTLQTNDTISVTDGLLISNNLRINIYRQPYNSTARYLIASLPNDPRTSAMTFVDNYPAATTPSSITTAPSNGGQVFIPTVSNTLTVGNVIGPLNPNTITVTSGGSTIDAINQTFTVVSIQVNGFTIQSIGTFVMQAGAIWKATDLSYTTFQGNLNPLNGTVPTRDPPPKADYCTMFNNQLILSKGNLIYWCDTSQPIISNAGLSFNIGLYFGSFRRPITALFQSGSSLIIAQDNRLDMYQGADLIFDVIIQKTLSNKIGCVAASAVTSAGQRTWFLDKSGIYEIDNGQIVLNKATYTYATTGINVNQTSTLQDQLAASTGIGGSTSIDLSYYFTGFTNYAWTKAVLGFDPQNNFLLVYLPFEIAGVFDYYTTPAISLMFELRRDRWYPWSLNFGGGITVDSQFNMYFVSRSYGKSLRTNVCRMHRVFDNSGYYDHNNAISCFYTTKYDQLHEQLQLTQKCIKSISLYNIPKLSNDYLHQPTISVQVLKDYIGMKVDTLSYTFPTQVDNNNKVGNAWNSFAWNNVPFKSWKPPIETLYPNPEDLEAYQLVISNSDPGQNCKITGWSVQWIPRSNLKQ